jgi:hypothetical protein
MIERITDGRTDSAGEMTAVERHAFLDELTRKGFRPAPPREREQDWINIDPNSPDAQHKRKLLACAFEMERCGAVSANSTRRWLRGFIKRVTGRDALQWLDAGECNQVIEGLKAWRKRFEAKHGISGNDEPRSELRDDLAIANAAPTAPAMPVTNGVDGSGCGGRTMAPAAIPATAIAKAAAYDALQLASEPGSPLEGIRNTLTMLASQNFSNPQIEAQVAELIHEFGERARRALLRWDFRKVRTELLWLMERVAEIEPSIAERMLTALKPEDGETPPRGPQNRKSKGGD